MDLTNKTEVELLEIPSHRQESLPKEQYQNYYNWFIKLKVLLEDFTISQEQGRQSHYPELIDQFIAKHGLIDVPTELDLFGLKDEPLEETTNQP